MLETGRIPPWIGAITGLKLLNFRSNRFYGNIPSEIHIHILDLYGRLPDCFNNLTELTLSKTIPRSLFGYGNTYQINHELPNAIYTKYEDEYSVFQWKGQESEYRKNLFILTLIDFSSNNFTGNIPQSVANMKGLISLNLSRNNLTGNIIPDIGQMEMLECLDLSNNQLSGQIPRSLENLTFLSVLDLSNNNLSGKTPSCTQLQSFGISSYDGNNGLCGRPMALCPPTTSDEDGGLWGLSFMQGFIISMAFRWIVGFWSVIGSLVLKKSWRYACLNLLGIGFMSRLLFYPNGDETETYRVDQRRLWVAAFASN